MFVHGTLAGNLSPELAKRVTLVRPSNTHHTRTPCAPTMVRRFAWTMRQSVLDIYSSEHH